MEEGGSPARLSAIILALLPHMLFFIFFFDLRMASQVVKYRRRPFHIHTLFNDLSGGKENTWERKRKEKSKLHGCGGNHRRGFR